MTPAQRSDVRRVLTTAGLGPEAVDCAMAALERLPGDPVECAHALASAIDLRSDDHGSHVYVLWLHPVGEDLPPLWARYCRRCATFGPVRRTYETAVGDGQAHAGPS